MASQNFKRSIERDLQEAHGVLVDFINEHNIANINKAIELMVATLSHGGCIYTAGNGGSMCDAMHFAEELTGRYRENRPSYSAIAISDPSYLSCVGNDYGFDFAFSRFLSGVANSKDAFLGISSSGNSQNIIEACKLCRQRNIPSVLLLGKDGGKLKSYADVAIIVDHHGFADRIQEIHTLVIHIMISNIEQKLLALSKD